MWVWPPQLGSYPMLSDKSSTFETIWCVPIFTILPSENSIFTISVESQIKTFKESKLTIEENTMEYV